STAKRVRRHGVDPNRSRNEEDMRRATFDFQATARPTQAEPISGKGTVGSAFLSPSRPDQPPPVGRPELIGKPCFPTEASEAQPTSRRNLQRAVEVRGIHHRAIHSFRAIKKFWDWSKYKGDSAEISAEVEEKFEKKLR
ncbi:hypothetical protein Prudu_021446, partial [Prunus dulcis]